MILRARILRGLLNKGYLASRGAGIRGFHPLIVTTHQLSLVPFWLSGSNAFSFSTSDHQTAASHSFKIPLGQTDFGAVQKMQGYVDKTLFLQKLITSHILLITYPRCWGKSLTLSMIRYYFCCSILQRKVLLEELRNMEKYYSSLQQRQKLYELSQQQLKKIIKEKATATKSIDDIRQRIKAIKDPQLEFKKMFENKLISQQDFYKGLQGYPIINIELKSSISGQNDEKEKKNQQQQRDTVIKNLKISVSRTFQEHSYLISSLERKILYEITPSQKNYMNIVLAKFCRIHDYEIKIRETEQKIKTGELPNTFDLEALFSDMQFERSIDFLSVLLEEYWMLKPLILIEQYENPYIVNADKPFRAKIFNMIYLFYIDFVQGNEAQSNQKVILTCTFPIVNLDIFGHGLGNFASVGINNFGHLGYRTEEVRAKLRLVLQQRNEPFSQEMFQTQFDYLSGWCGGYWLLGWEIHNPWSVNFCLQEILKADKLPLQQFPSSWVESEHLNLIRKLIKNANQQEESIMIRLILNGFQIEDHCQLQRYLRFEKIMRTDSLLYYLFYTGFVANDRNRDNNYRSNVPNREVAQRFLPKLLMMWLERRYPGISGQQQDTARLENRADELLTTVHEIDNFKDHLHYLMNSLIKIRKTALEGRDCDDQRVTIQDLRQFERDVWLFVSAQQVKLLLKNKKYLGYTIEFRRDDTKFDQYCRFISSSVKDTAIIHANGVALQKDQTDDVICETLNRIVSTHLDFVLRKIVNKLPHVKYIQIVAVVITKTSDTSNVAEQLPSYFDLTAKKFAFTIEGARKLLEKYEKRFGVISYGEVIHRNKDEREVFMKMLTFHQKKVETTADL